MAAVAAGSVDIDKPGKYPIVLSDALLGKASKEVYTGVRCTRRVKCILKKGLTGNADNHKPDHSSDSSSSMHLEPSDSSGYDLSFTNNSDKYSYHGARKLGDGQYVLIFDPVKEHFVLHRIDSTFEMNLVSAPWARDASTLRSQYKQLETPQSKTPAASATPQRKPSKTTKKAAAAAKPETQRKKVEKAKKPKPPPRELSPEEEEESDDGLTIEYPDGPNSQSYQYQATSTPVFRRDPSEDASEEDSDADAEGEEYVEERNQDVDHLKLPSPANNNAGGLSDEEMELDLEAELEQALKETEGGGADESSESEEE
jgi:hypothetical protein